MSEQNKKIELLESAPIPKALLAMGLPTMIGMMINALYNLVDAYFVGGWGPAKWVRFLWHFLWDRLW